MTTIQRDNLRGPGALRRHSRQVALKVVAGQLVAGIAVIAVMLLLGGKHAGYSALVGTLIGTLPNYYLMVRIFRWEPTDTPESLLKRVYLGESIKLIFTTALFVIALVMMDVNFALVIVAYAATAAAHGIALRYVDLSETPRDMY